MSKPYLVHDKWDSELAQMTYEEMRDNCLFAVIWSERPKGGYNQSDFYPFVAMKKVLNQGVEAYEGILLDAAFDEYEKDGVKYRVRKVGVHARAYMPLSFLADTDRITVFSNPDELLEPFLKRWQEEEPA